SQPGPASGAGGRGRGRRAGGHALERCAAHRHCPEAARVGRGGGSPGGAAAEGRLLEGELAEEAGQVEAARLRLATGRPTRLSELGTLDPHAFGLFLNLLGEALAEQEGPEATVE